MQRDVSRHLPQARADLRNRRNGSGGVGVWCECDGQIGVAADLRVVDAQPQTVEALQQALTPMSEVVARRIDRLMSIVRQCAGAKATDKNM